jgi:hypothetical protein
MGYCSATDEDCQDQFEDSFGSENEPASREVGGLG